MHNSTLCGPPVTSHCAAPCCAVQIAKAVEDILYAATQEEGEASLAAAIAELEVHEQEEEHAEQVRAAFVRGQRWS